ncbi:MAG TPA: hypothetical protein VGH28_13710 [Polyangiaceae bacterium]|jgi:DnaJ-class molecular chaperone
MSTPDDTDRTPTACPAAKRSSGELRILVTTCPKCEGRGSLGPFSQPPSETICDLCNGGRKIGHAEAIDWILTSSSSAPPPPDTERP